MAATSRLSGEHATKTRLQEVRMAKHNGTMIVAMSILGGSLLAGCSAAGEPDAGVEKETRTAIPTSSNHGGNWGIISFDVEPVNTVDELVLISELGVTGTVSGFTEARLQCADPQSPEQSFEPVVVRLDAPSAVSGELPEGNDGHVYIALAGTASAEEYAESIAVGTEVIAYGHDMTTLSDDVRCEVLDGVPAGQGVINITHPSGFGLEIVESSARAAAPTLVFPMYGMSVPEMSVDDLLPGDTVPVFEEKME
jgi:hypothetical protein